MSPAISKNFNDSMYSKLKERSVRCIVVATVAVAFFTMFLPQGWTYDKPPTYSHDQDKIIFKDQYMKFPHTWSIVKALELLRQDGYHAEADLAERYLLPMLEGAVFNDVWGDADLAGASVLDYYIPDKPGQNFGYGSAAAAYKHATQEFQNHPFYGYGNAAEHAQFRYEYARRVYLGNWGSDPRDLMAGWVEDTCFGQNDPINGNKYAAGAAAINAIPGFGGKPADVLSRLLREQSQFLEIFPKQNPADNDNLSKIFVGKKTVFDHEKNCWCNPLLFCTYSGYLDYWLHGADAIEAYNGFDGVDSAVYASWTTDTGDDSASSPFIFYVPANSREHSFFLLGWAMHLLADNTLPVHTIDSSWATYNVHNDVEGFADKAITDQEYMGHAIRDALPALSKSEFQALYHWPPPTCEDITPDPGNLYQQRWYADNPNLKRNPGEGVAHAYVRNFAEIAHKYWPYLEPAIFGACINTETDEDQNWEHMGFFTTLELDMAIKGTAGLLHQFLAEVGANDQTPPTITLTTMPSNPTKDANPTFTGNVTDAGSNVRSVEYSVDNGLTWNLSAATDGAFDSQTEEFSFKIGPLSDGTYTVMVRATDVSNNTTAPGAYVTKTFLVDTTPPMITITQPAAVNYLHSGTITLNYTVTDGTGSGVATVTPTLDGQTTVAGHGLASGQKIKLLTELTLGSHIFTVTAVDRVGNSATVSVTFWIIVTPQSIEDDLKQFIASGQATLKGTTFQLPKMELRELVGGLMSAAAARADGDCFRAAWYYQDFIGELGAQSGVYVNPTAAAIMIGDARYLLAHCP